MIFHYLPMCVISLVIFSTIETTQSSPIAAVRVSAIENRSVSQSNQLNILMKESTEYSNIDETYLTTTSSATSVPDDTTEKVSQTTKPQEFTLLELISAYEKSHRIPINW